MRFLHSFGTAHFNCETNVQVTNQTKTNYSKKKITLFINTPNIVPSILLPQSFFNEVRADFSLFMSNQRDSGWQPFKKYIFYYFFQLFSNYRL